MNNPYALGFVKRAQEYGLTANQAFQLGKQAGIESLLNSGKEHFGRGLESLKGMIAGIPAAFPGDNNTEDVRLLKSLGLGEALSMGWDRLNPAAQGALMGAGVGGIGGAMIPSEDEEGETHRLRNALLGMSAGGLAGAGLNNNTAKNAIIEQLQKAKNFKDGFNQPKGSLGDIMNDDSQFD